MMKHVLALTAAAAALLAAQPAAASHVFFSNVEIDGVALETALGFTNPLFNINVGDTLTFSADVSGSSDTLNGDLSGFTGVSPDPFSLAFGGGSANLSQVLTFSTVGNYTGSILVNLSASSPDYVVPGSSSQTDSRRFAFRVNVSNGVAPIPEPATWALMIMGFGSAGAMIRRRRHAIA